MSVASAWTMGPDVFVYDGDAVTTLYIKTETGELDTFDYESESGAPVFDGVTINFTPNSGSWTWNVTNLTPRMNYTFEGNVTQSGSLRMSGLSGMYWRVEGVSGMPTFVAAGPSFAFSIPAASQTFSITPSSLLLSGVYITLDSDYNAPQDTISSVVVILDSNRTPVADANVSHSTFYPNGTLYHSVFMTSTSIPGVYRANVTLASPEGGWHTTASYDGSVAAQTFTRQTDMISLAIDEYLPMIIFGGLLLFFLWVDAIFPAIVSVLTLANAIFPTPIWGLKTSIMFLALAILLHAIIFRWPHAVRWLLTGAGAGKNKNGGT